MFGKNPIRPPVHDDGTILQVVEIFPTLQGEGPRAGEPAVFVRLGGCNLACDFCDTEFEAFAPMQITEIVEHIKNSSSLILPLNEKGISLIVITGGEPLRQNIVPLCEALVAAKFIVQIETNGTLWRPLPEAVEVVCSPKNSGQGYMPIRPDVYARANALKYIVSATHPLYRDIPENLHGTVPPVFVQPMDEYNAAKNAANMEYAEELATKHQCAVSRQMHKIWGLP